MIHLLGGYALALLTVANCRVTQPPDPPFVPPALCGSQTPHFTSFWYGYGTETLWTRLPVSGDWGGLPHNQNGYRQKIFWWRPGFDGRLEQRPAPVVTGRYRASTVTFVVFVGPGR